MDLDAGTIRRLQRKLRLKHAIDRLAATLALLLLWPLFLLVALAIKLDGALRPEHAGPVFYTEPRLSAGETFRIIKFRTAPMHDVRWIREQPRTRSIASCRSTTRAGRWILRWYLDELPQLINILRGEMSFVGPRPHIELLARREEALGLGFRNALRAGLLGVVQAYKRDPRYREALARMAREQQADARLGRELDGAYLRQLIERSALGIVALDAWLILRGLAVVLRGQS